MMKETKKVCARAKEMATIGENNQGKTMHIQQQQKARKNCSIVTNTARKVQKKEPKRPHNEVREGRKKGRHTIETGVLELR